MVHLVAVLLMTFDSRVPIGVTALFGHRWRFIAMWFGRLVALQIKTEHG